MLFFFVPVALERPPEPAAFKPRRIHESPQLPPDPAREAKIACRRRELAHQALLLGVHLDGCCNLAPTVDERRNRSTRRRRGRDS